MTAVAARGRLGGATAVLGTVGAASVAAAAALVLPLELVVAGAIALIGAAAIVLSPRAGLAAVAVFTVLRIPEVATEFHGAPSLFLPLLALIALGLLVANRQATSSRGGVSAAVAVAAFLGVAAISLLTAPDATGTLSTLRGIAEDGSVAVLAGLLLGGTASLRGLAWALVVAGGAVGALAVVQFTLGEFATNFFGFAQWAVQNIVDTTDDVRISGPVGDPNFFAQWLVMLLPLAIDRFADETHRRMRLLAAGCAGAMTAAIVLTFSRGGLLGLAVIGLVMLMRSPRRMRMLAALAMVTAALVLLAPGRYLERLSALSDLGGVEAGIDPSVRARTAELTAALRMFSADPLTGVGYGSFSEHYAATVRDLGIDLRATPREAHNLVLQFAAEMGIVGVLLLAGLAAAVAASIRRGRRHFRSISDGRGDGLGYAVAVGLVGYVVTSFFLHLDFARLPWLLTGVALALPRVARLEDASREMATHGVER
ncbi:MAG: O-antigen ligase family protein [Acidimicrobiia bacterium]|nr:O-antigen ligase family protein [Acidimicrobiia bacterium]